LLCFAPYVVSGGDFDGGRKGDPENWGTGGAVFAGGLGGEFMKSLSKSLEFVGGWPGIGASDGDGPKLANDVGAGYVICDGDERKSENSSSSSIIVDGG
jgi:hypothetical protein